MPSSRTASRARGGSQAQPDTEQRGVVVFDPKKKATDLVEALEQRREQIAAFLQVRSPEDAERFITVAVDAIVRDQGLLQADLLSLVNSVRHASIMGLEPTSIMGEGAIVVYRDNDQGGKKIAQFQPMVRGLQKLARNSGEVASIGCDVVRRLDRFEFHSGSNPSIVHDPYLPGFTDPDVDLATLQNDVIGAYAYIRLLTGELLPLFMSTAEIHKRRSQSASWRNSQEKSVWGQWPEEMMKKTVLRRLLVERAPLSFRAQRALALDAAIDTGGDTEAAEPRVTRSANRLLADFGPSPENGSGADGNGEAGKDTGQAEEGAQRGSTEPTGDPEPVEAEVREVNNATCGVKAPQGYSGGSCDAVEGHPGMHKNSDAETWS